MENVLMTATPADELKRTAAEAAARRVVSGMLVGLGTGSTAIHAVPCLAARLRSGELRDIRGIPTSYQSLMLARQLGIPLIDLDDPKASDILYVKALAAAYTVNTMPEATLKALATHEDVGELLPGDGGDCEEVLTRFAAAGVNVAKLGTKLQTQGAEAFVKSWKDLLEVISSKSAALGSRGAEVHP
jgi:hypothetical protein